MITHYPLTNLHSQVRKIALMLLMFLSIESSVGQAKPAAPGTGGEQQVPSGEYIGPLELGKPVERELAGNAIHVYSLSLVAGQFVNVIVEQRGIDVVVVLIGPDGKKTIEVDSPNGTYGTEPLMSVAEVAGPYELKVRSLEKSAPRGRYVVTLAQLRDGTAADRALVSELGEATRLSDQVSKLSATGKFKDAIPLAERVLLIKEKAFAEHIDVATASNELAKLYQAQGNYARAEKAYRRALEIRERTFGAEHQDVAATLNNLGTLYYFKGDYGPAEESYQRALRIRERVFDPNDSRIATTLSNLAALYEVKGDYARSELMYQRALTIYQTALGPEHPFVGATLNNLGVLYKEIGDYVRAEPLYLRALEIREKALGPTHPDVAETLNNLAVIYRDQGQPERAEPLYVRALAIEEKVLGPEHPYVALILSNLAVIYDDREDYARHRYLREDAWPGTSGTCLDPCQPRGAV